MPKLLKHILSVSTWIFSLFSMNISWQKSDCQKSENSIEPVDKLINFILSLNSLLWSPLKNSSYFGISSFSIFDEISVSSGMGSTFIFWSLLLPWLTYLPPPPLKSALKAVLTSEDHTYQGLVFQFLVSF